MGERRVWPIVIAAVVGCAILVGLGMWQLYRLQWKEALIAEIDRRAEAPPLSLEAALGMKPDEVEHARIAATGTFLPGELHVLTTYDGKPGWEIVQPLRTGGGIVVLVDRGVVPDELRVAASRPPLPTEVSLAGVASRHSASPGLFTPVNDVAANIWYSWDIPAMLAAVSIPADARVAPFVLHALDPPPGQEFPKPVPLRSSLVNNHLSYAITWFALALVLAIMSALFIRQQVRRTGA